MPMTYFKYFFPFILLNTYKPPAPFFFLSFFLSFFFFKGTYLLRLRDPENVVLSFVDDMMTVQHWLLRRSNGVFCLGGEPLPGCSTISVGPRHACMHACTQKRNDKEEEKKKNSIGRGEQGRSEDMLAGGNHQ
jgi:hypothetical protein